MRGRAPHGILCSTLVLAGCSDLLGIGDLSGPPPPVDARIFRDAPIDVPDQITITG